MIKNRKKEKKKERTQKRETRNLKNTFFFFLSATTLSGQNPSIIMRSIINFKQY
jgi:reverse gyrase